MMASNKPHGGVIAGKWARSGRFLLGRFSSNCYVSFHFKAVASVVDAALMRL
jgi:hypothetical protein